MTPSPNCSKIIHRAEVSDGKPALVAYLCPAKVWTIGFGSTFADGRIVREGDTCTPEQAEKWFQMDLDVATQIVSRMVVAEMNQNQFDAMVSIVQNVGPGRVGRAPDPGRDGIRTLKSGRPSTLLRKLNAMDYPGCAAEFLKWTHGGGGILPGLVRRRAVEAALFRGEADFMKHFEDRV